MPFFCPSLSISYSSGSFLFPLTLLCTLTSGRSGATSAWFKCCFLGSFLFSVCHYFFPFLDFFFHEILAGPVFFFFADVHCALVGLQAGYGRLLFPFLADFLPQGLPVLQSIHPFPPLRPNHFFNPSLAILLLLRLISPILSTFFTALY